jgi:2-keto-4-pentenoate hydratase
MRGSASAIPFLHDRGGAGTAYRGGMSTTCDSNDDELAAWAAGLAPARLTGGSIAEPPAPITLAEGYRLAMLGEGLLGTPAGWKIGATSARAMDFLGIDAPIRGRLFAERIWTDGARADLPRERPAEAEPEIAFRLARDLNAGEAPLAAVGEAFAAAEIVRPSHPDAFRLGAGFIVADNAAGIGALIGPPIPLALLAEPGDITVALSVEGGDACEGRADAVLGNPLAALAWLARDLGTVPAGAWVLSGAMAGAIPLVAPTGEERLRLDAGPHGTATLRF